MTWQSLMEDDGWHDRDAVLSVRHIGNLTLEARANGTWQLRDAAESFLFACGETTDRESAKREAEQAVIAIATKVIAAIGDKS